MQAFQARKIVRWLLLTWIIAFVITGLGILYYHTIQALTLGILTKSLSFQIHTNTYFLISFLILLILHIYLALKSIKN